MTKKKTVQRLTQDYCGVSLSQRKTSAYWEKVSQWFAVIMLTVFPFLMGTKGYYDITESRYMWFRVLTDAFLGACLLILIGYLFLSRELWQKRKAEGFQKPTISQYLMAAYMLWATISSLVSPYRADTWLGQGRYEGLLTIFLYSLTFICLSFWAEYTNKYVCGLAIMATVLSVMAILQPLGIDPFTPAEYDFWEVRFFATVGNIDCISGIGAMVIPALFCGFLLLESRWRYLCLTGLVLYFYLQLYVEVESGMVGLLAAFAVLLPFLFTNPKRAFRAVTAFGAMLVTYGLEKFLPITQTGFTFSFGKKALLALVLGALMIAGGILLGRKNLTFSLSEKKIRRIVTVIVLAAFLAGVVFVYGYRGDVQTLQEASQMLHGEITPDMGTLRGEIWMLCGKFIKERPLFGSGPDTLLSRARPYYDSGAVRQVYDYAHNDFLQVAVCLGLVGLAIYLAWIVSMTVRILKRASSNPLLLIFGGAMVGYLGHVFFSFSIALVTPLFWVMAGIADKLMRQMVDAPEGEK